jgi:hypothetical protein
MATKLLDPGTSLVTSSNITVSSGERVTLFVSADATSGTGGAEVQVESATDTYVPVYSLSWMGNRTCTFEGPVKFNVRGNCGVYRA